MSQTVICNSCGHEYGIGDSPYCRDGHLPWHTQPAQSFDPVVVYKAPDGSYRFPGMPHDRMTTHYDRLGYTRVECRTTTEVRALETTMNRVERSRMSRRTERLHQEREQRQSIMRSDLRQRMQSMSAMGRDVARAAMDRNDRRPAPSTPDAGFHVEAFANDASNREACHDSRASMRGRK